jgi:hypothetical protein
MEIDQTSQARTPDEVQLSINLIGVSEEGVFNQTLYTNNRTFEECYH